MHTALISHANVPGQIDVGFAPVIGAGGDNFSHRVDCAVNY